MTQNISKCHKIKAWTSPYTVRDQGASPIKWHELLRSVIIYPAHTYSWNNAIIDQGSIPTWTRLHGQMRSLPVCMSYCMPVYSHTNYNWVHLFLDWHCPASNADCSKEKYYVYGLQYMYATFWSFLHSWNSWQKDCAKAWQYEDSFQCLQHSVLSIMSNNWNCVLIQSLQRRKEGTRKTHIIIIGDCKTKEQ